MRCRVEDALSWVDRQPRRFDHRHIQSGDEPLGGRVVAGRQTEDDEVRRGVDIARHEVEYDTGDRNIPDVEGDIRPNRCAGAAPGHAENVPRL